MSLASNYQVLLGEIVKNVFPFVPSSVASHSVVSLFSSQGTCSSLRELLHFFQKCHQAPFRNDDLLCPCRFKKRHLVGSSGLEPPTSRLSGARSNHLSYEPISCGERSILGRAIGFQSSLFGGDEQNRTVDPLLARQVLSQLSYTPTSGAQHILHLPSEITGPFVPPCNFKEIAGVIPKELRKLIRRIYSCAL
jgi:hypothetical protein